MSRLKLLGLLLITLLLILATNRFLDSDLAYIYKRHFFVSQSHLQLDFNDLTPVSAAEIARKYPINWYCFRQTNEFGDSGCADELKTWNGLTAVLTVFWYKNGNLQNAKINVPPWEHQALIDYLMKTYGEPDDYTNDKNLPNLIAGIKGVMKGTPKDKIAKSIHDRGIWHLPTGAWLMVNINRSFNPLDWSTVFWMSPDTIQQIRQKATKPH